MRRLIVVVCVVLVSSMLFAEERGQVLPYDVLIRSAKAYMTTKPINYEKIAELLNKAIANYPDPVEAHFLLGNLCSDQGKYIEMMDHFKQFEDICAKNQADPKFKKRCEKDDMPRKINDAKISDYSKLQKEGLALLKNADSTFKTLNDEPDSAKAAEKKKGLMESFDKAKSDFEVCAMIDDTVAAVWANLALIEYRKDNKEASYDYYEKSIKYDSSNVSVLFETATSAMNLKKFERGAQLFDRIALIDSLDAEVALTNRAVCFQSLHDDVRLKETYDRILKINPKNAEILYFRGMMFVLKASSREVSDSSAVLDSIAEKHPNDKALEKARQDFMDYRLNFYKLALPDFKAAAESAETEPDYWYWYGFSALLSDKSAEGEVAFNKCVQIKPDHKDCWCQLETVLAKLNKQAEFDKAKKQCETLQ